MTHRARLYLILLLTLLWLTLLASIADLPAPAQAAYQTATPRVTCPSRRPTCSALRTCAQARACLRAGHRRLDADRDGVPCERLCSGG